jgi:hypothetical protein
LSLFERRQLVRLSILLDYGSAPQIELFGAKFEELNDKLLVELILKFDKLVRF